MTRADLIKPGPVALAISLLAVVLQGCAVATVTGAAVGVTAKVAGTAVGLGADAVGAAGKMVTGARR